MCAAAASRSDGAYVWPISGRRVGATRGPEVEMLGEGGDAQHHFSQICDVVHRAFALQQKPVIKTSCNRSRLSCLLMGFVPEHAADRLPINYMLYRCGNHCRSEAGLPMLFPTQVSNDMVAAELGLAQGSLTYTPETALQFKTTLQTVNDRELTIGEKFAWHLQSYRPPEGHEVVSMVLSKADHECWSRALGRNQAILPFVQLEPIRELGVSEVLCSSLLEAYERACVDADESAASARSTGAAAAAADRNQEKGAGGR